MILLLPFNIQKTAFCNFIREFPKEGLSLEKLINDLKKLLSSRTGNAVACSRLRDGGGKSFSNKKCEKRTGAGERQGGRPCTHFFNGLFQYISS